MDTTNTVVSAQDYDAWGYILENRSYNSDTVRYKFTGKERDKDLESNYDYFGARYYDRRIGRWSGLEPKLDALLNFTPYNYGLNNPIMILDPNGKDPRRNQMANLDEVITSLETNKDMSIEEFIQNVLPGNESKRYVYTEEGGFIDLMHFFAAADVTGKLMPFDPTGGVIAKMFGRDLGEYMELFQALRADDSQWDPEDLPSNLQGSEFGALLGLASGKITSGFINQFKKFMIGQKILDKDDPKIGRDKVKIRENQYDKALPPNYLDYRPYRGEQVARSANRG